MKCIVYALLCTASILYGSVESQEGRKRTIVASGEGEGWKIVESRSCTGTPFVVPPIGHTIDQEERDQLRLFYGPIDGITNPHLAPFLRPISGFLSARFIRTIDGQHFVVVEKSVGHENDLVLLPISERTIAAFRRYAKGTLVPKPEGQRVSHRTETFWVRNDLHTMRARRQGSVVLADSSRVDGILLPTLENGALPIVQPNGQVALIPVERVRWLQIRRSLLRQVMSTTIGKGVEGALTGATVGFMAGLFQEGFSVGEEMRLGAIVGGVVGLGFGFIDGVFSAEKSREYMIHPVASPDRLELRIVMAL